jgi:hypothetical protein
VVIRQSSAREVSTLLRDLQNGPEAAREAAAARLAVIGTRAVAGLLSLLTPATQPDVHVATFATLEAIGDPRSIDAGLAGLADADSSVRAGAASLLRRLLESARGPDVLDRLTAIAVDASGSEVVRLGALDALRQVPGPAMGLIAARLAGDPSLAVRAWVAGIGGSAVVRPLDALELAAAALPDSPDAIRQWLAVAGADAPLPTLHRLVQRIHEHEKPLSDAVQRATWATARAAAHQVLAERGSTVALYDLRETIESGETVAVEMLAALALIGDRTCLEPLAAAYDRLARPAGGPAHEPQDAGWWLEHLARTFRAITTREHLSERQVVLKRIRTKWPQAAGALLGPSR